jgi:hypothetical protein
MRCEISKRMTSVLYETGYEIRNVCRSNRYKIKRNGMKYPNGMKSESLVIDKHVSNTT